MSDLGMESRRRNCDEIIPGAAWERTIEVADENDKKIAVFMPMTTMRINDKGLPFFCAKTGAKKVAFWGRKMAF